MNEYKLIFGNKTNIERYRKAIIYYDSFNLSIKLS